MFKKFFLVLTPFYCGYILYKIKDKMKKPDIIEKYGSLFYEFKHDKGFASSLFYLVYFIRRLQFILTQTLLYAKPYVQFSLNLIFSLMQLAYIILFKPFKENSTMISELIGEFCVVFIIFLSGFMLSSNTIIPTHIINPLFIYLIMITIGIQSLISLGSLYGLIKQIVNKIKEYKLKKMTKKSQKVFPEKSFVATGGSTDNN